MSYVISFLAPHTRLSSRQNADAISKGYQFMQQFTLSLKASLASEAKALERKCEEVLCYPLQLSPSALPWRSGIPPALLRHPAAGKGRASDNCLHPPHSSLRNNSRISHGSKPLCGAERVPNSQSQSSRGIICELKTEIKLRFPVLETAWSSCQWVMLCRRGGVP